MAALLNWPNRITITRTLLIPAFVICVLNVHDVYWLRWVALGVLLAIGLGDALDGYLARRWSQETWLGAVLDPLADKLLMATACILLAVEAIVTPWLPWTIPNWVVVTVIFRDLVLVAGSLVLMLAGNLRNISPTPLGKATTAAQMLLLLGTLLGPELNAVAGDWFRWCLWAPAVALTAASGLIYVRQGLRLLTAGGNHTADPDEETR